MITHPLLALKPGGTLESLGEVLKTLMPDLPSKIPGHLVWDWAQASFSVLFCFVLLRFKQLPKFWCHCTDWFPFTHSASHRLCLHHVLVLDDLTSHLSQGSHYFHHYKLPQQPHLFNFFHTHETKLTKIIQYLIQNTEKDKEKIINNLTTQGYLLRTVLCKCFCTCEYTFLYKILSY